MSIQCGPSDIELKSNKATREEPDKEPITGSKKTRYTVILFSSRYLLSAKSICPTCKQTIYIFMQNMRAAPSNQ
jgi:hypothetical protein